MHVSINTEVLHQPQFNLQKTNVMTLNNSNAFVFAHRAAFKTTFHYPTELPWEQTLHKP
jgi:hypothetical protein